jgi:hypothetical protein
LLRIIYRRNGINPAQISGPYSLLAVMLLVVEILFAIWFYKSQSPLERTIAGSIIAIVFISLMLLILRIAELPTKKNGFQKQTSLERIYPNLLWLHHIVDELG